MKRILTVDDSRSLRKMVRVSLESAGFEVVEAEDGKQALKECESGKFDLILTDQNMPNMDGLTFIQQIRQKAGFGAVPILMLTTEASDDMKQRGRSAGATGWIVKPFDPARLLMVVGKVLG